MKMSSTIVKSAITSFFVTCVVLLELKAKTIKTIPTTCKILFCDFVTPEFVVHWFSVLFIAFPMITITFFQIALSKYVLLTRKRLMQYHIHTILFYFNSLCISTILGILLILFSKTHEYPLCILLFSKSTENQEIVFNCFIVQLLLVTSSLYYISCVLTELTTLNQRLGGKIFSFNFLSYKILIKFAVYALIHVLPNIIFGLTILYRLSKSLDLSLTVFGMMFYVYAISILSILAVITVSWLRGGRITKRRRAYSVIYPAQQLNECSS